MISAPLPAGGCLKSLVVVALIFGAQLALGTETDLCPHVRLMDGKMKLNKNEKVLICGSGKEGETWEDVPIPQARLHLTGLLQNLGYLSPRFEREDDHLRVWRGDLTKIKALAIDPHVDELNPDKKRQVVGQPLVPAKLDETNSWADQTLRTRGYACPVVSTVAEAWREQVSVHAQPGKRQKIGDVEVGELANLHRETLDRYQPFEKGDWYDVRETDLMTQRMLADGLFQTAYFLADCKGEDVALTLKTNVGRPRILRAEFGASTEEYPFTDLTYISTRLDDRASSLNARLHASPRKQSITTSAEIYLIPDWQRTFVGPRFELAHTIERGYELNTAKTGIDLGRRWDTSGIRWIGRAGPTLNYSQTVKGIGPDGITFVTIDGSMNAQSHGYEAATYTQDQGWTSTLTYLGQRKGLGSSLNVNRVDFTAKYLWNPGSYSPPLFVVGARFHGAVVSSDALDQPGTQNLLPTEDRIFYGGDTNLRGFGRQTLDNNTLGYLAAAYAGFEVRLVEELPFHLQPLVLYDVAQLGTRPSTLDATVFTSEGVGLRWGSPFGTIRGTVARGHILNRNESAAAVPEQWVYFFSFGQEF